MESGSYGCALPVWCGAGVPSQKGLTRATVARPSSASLFPSHREAAWHSSLQPRYRGSLPATLVADSLAQPMHRRDSSGAGGKMGPSRRLRARGLTYFEGLMSDGA
ncbi:hypothetical protein NDU88_007792 [Pleurodeles waltl]|uniref:Uncharacterized protein n=1 Tax=Pleurodeles waltl TaxID=8319 RepID=A0AAV7PQA9_PLEWA|nr:hypothetical protein NDU88_007792 [Pleurodeles waltl]